MTQTVASFRADCAKLRDELTLAPVLEAALAAAEHDTHRLAHLTAIARRQSYVSAIVSIYGLLEEYVDRSLLEIVTTYDDLYTSHATLPERTRKAHRELSLRALLDGERVRLRTGLDHLQTMHALAAHVAGQAAPMIADVFTYATANYRHPYICELFTRTDVDLAEELGKGQSKVTLTETGLEFGDVQALISDLVERRNEVAHSYETPRTLDTSTLTAYLDVVEAYILELSRHLDQQLLRRLAEQRLHAIGVVKNVFDQANALAVDMVAGELEAPCIVLARKESGVKVLHVQSLQSGGKALTGRVAYAGALIQLGVGIDGSVSGCDNADIFVVPPKWTYLTV